MLFNWQPVEVLEVCGDAILSVAVSEELGSKVHSGALLRPFANT